MQFNSYSYALLLVPVVSLFWMLPAHLRRWYVFALSMAYYATWNPLFIVVPLVLALGVHACAARVRQPSGGKFWLRAGIGFVLAIFLFCRYRQFLIANVNGVLTAFGAHPLAIALRLAVPLGISFYSFEAIGYLIDTSQGRVKN